MTPLPIPCRPELLFGDAELSENAQIALQSAIREANRLGKTVVGTEMLLWALFQKTKHNAESRHWLLSVCFNFVLFVCSTIVCLLDVTTFIIIWLLLFMFHST